MHLGHFARRNPGEIHEDEHDENVQLSAVAQAQFRSLNGYFDCRINDMKQQ
jgi:hypothetical protein